MRALMILLASFALMLSPAWAEMVKTKGHKSYRSSSNTKSIHEGQANLGAMEIHGFKGMADIYRNLTPEQKKAVIEQANKRKAELEAMSPKERRALENRLREASAAYAKDDGYERIDPSMLDASQAQSIEGTLEQVEAVEELQRNNPRR